MAEPIVRKTRPEDIPVLLFIYEFARQRMRETGNPNQWISYPERNILENDVRHGRSYVIEDENGICGTFVFFAGNDPTYDVIDGFWLNEEPYGVIHRIAGNGSRNGILHTAVLFASQHTHNIRIDTHPDNIVMQKALAKEGFCFTGTIYIPDDISVHSPRLAYQKVI